MVGSIVPGTPVPTLSPFFLFLLCPGPLSVPSSTPPSSFLILLGRPPRPAQRTPVSRISLTYFGTISARGAGESTGTLEALGTGRAAFTWEPSFSLWQRHQGAIRPER